MSKLLTPNRVALLTAGLLDVAALCTGIAGVVPGSVARAIIEIGALASAGAKAITFAVGSWKHAQLVADTSPDPSTEPEVAGGGLPSDQVEQAAPPPADVVVTEAAPPVEDPARTGPPVQPSQTGLTGPGA